MLASKSRSKISRKKKFVFSGNLVAKLTDEWHQITSDKWILQTVRSGKVEIEDLCAKKVN